MFITNNITIGRKKSNNSSPFVLPIAIPTNDINELIINNTITNRYKYIFLYKANTKNISVSIIYGPATNGPLEKTSKIIFPVGKNKTPRNTIKTITI